MRAAVLVFPGTWSDGDCVWALQQVGIESRRVWHRETEIAPDELVVLPGGFSYGDYLRCGAIARFSPIMAAVRRHAEAGGLVIGICNGFQILCEAGLLPGVLMRNESLQFRCQDSYIVPVNRTSPFTSGLDAGRGYMTPVSHGEGRYTADEATVRMLEDSDRIAFRYGTLDGRITPEANPNGSVHGIAGILNERGNVLGLMPHPERSCEALLGNEDGNAIWRSALAAVGARV
ncbi:MAG: phosphoribosylformylglycinamidine synthase subunit PurQ [Dehalococcoidia bacterium]|nr:phosphoribosylformylglycinamidine synthase subunit PurQ [Dehalococcoidia bacterium]